jgi:pimeloyl-ACP methyl ester carboxylesterase
MSNAVQGGEGSSKVFTEGSVELAGVRIGFRVGGQGKPIIILHDHKLAELSPLEKLLTAEFRVVALMASGAELGAASRSSSGRELVPMLAHAVGLDREQRLALISNGASAPVALRTALEEPERVDALVLIAPRPIFSEIPAPLDRYDHDAALVARLPEIKTPILLLLGTDDAVIPPQTGGEYAELLPSCYYVLVYDAGNLLENERPQTLFVTIRDFLERRESFVVNRSSTILNP